MGSRSLLAGESGRTVAYRGNRTPLGMLTGVDSTSIEPSRIETYDVAASAAAAVEWKRSHGKGALLNESKTRWGENTNVRWMPDEMMVAHTNEAHCGDNNDSITMPKAGSEDGTDPSCRRHSIPLHANSTPPFRDVEQLAGSASVDDIRGAPGKGYQEERQPDGEAIQGADGASVEGIVHEGKVANVRQSEDLDTCTLLPDVDA